MRRRVRSSRRRTPNTSPSGCVGRVTSVVFPCFSFVLNLSYRLNQRHSTMLDPDVIGRIRHIFLHPRPHLSIFQATLLLGWTRRQMDEAIASGDVELMTTPIGKWFWRHELMSKALET